MAIKDMKDKSLAAFRRYSEKHLVGGVSSNFRFNPFTGEPMYPEKADGAQFYDIEGKRYIDYFMGHGAVLLGYNHPDVRQALLDVIDYGFFAEFDNRLTADLAARIAEIIPCAEQVRFTNSGSEATLLALRLARGYTGREKVIRMDGHFHGIHDYVLFNNLSTLVDHANPGDRASDVNFFSAGIPEAIPRETMIVVPWKNPEVLRKIMKEEEGRIAAVMMNPIDFNNGCITTTKEYLQEVNSIAHENGAIVIYDEILCGFRVGLSCAQGYYGVTPDLCTLSKAMSNGVPIAALAGSDRVMSKIMDPDLPVVHGGTYTGNLMGAAAGLASLAVMSKPDFYPELFGTADYFFSELSTLFREEGVTAQVPHLGSSFSIYFGLEEPVLDYSQLRKVDRDLASRFFSSCIANGIYFHTDFTVSAAHTRELVDETLEKMRAIVKSL